MNRHFIRLSVLFLCYFSFSQFNGLFAQNTAWSDTGRIGIGKTDPEYPLHVAHPTVVPAAFERINTVGNATNSSIILRHSTSAAITNGLGAAVSFQIKDNNTNTNYNLGFVAGVRTSANNSGSIVFNTANAGTITEKMRVNNLGNVGINLNNPVYLLDIFQNTNSNLPMLNIRNASNGTSAVARMNFFNNVGASVGTHGAAIALNSSTTSSPNSFVIFNYLAGPIRIGTSAQERIRITADGNVGIGTMTPPAAAKLAVEGEIHARKVKVTQATWADFVFAPNYKLPALTEVEAFIQQHRHLPYVPSEAEVKKNGLYLGENQAVLLRKIEELTLYAIDQEKKLATQQQQLQSQQDREAAQLKREALLMQRLEALEKEMEALKKK
ncbi:MAG: hypothetical protein P0Y53_22820 [Candidatus Pseudobacter hemicellulosilyticus]|uniref:Peptidase S74 domain-containing protein n=1 Tax=Candidatus Pseudobacter hemicellulosilyticus TaxID=3121375 RepID=A0AAJ5WRB4_9BACT|nr:MAG: hypothetical protein P0Y53_22820 [Pseudobacter sp.]